MKAYFPSTLPAATTALLCNIIKQDIYARQVTMGEEKGYALARTMRSCIQHGAARALEATERGNQCKRGTCMEAAMSMFAGKGAAGIPQSVVRAFFHY